MAKKQKTVKELRNNLANPRSISEDRLEMLKASLGEFGDLSGIVWNRRSGKLISGHQRRKSFPDTAVVTITKEYETPTRTGTVAEGYIENQGEKFTYREVDWDGVKEYAAMIAANRHGGKWNNKILAEVLLELDSNNINMSLVGMSKTDMENFFAPVNPPAVPPVNAPEVPAANAAGLQIECPKCGEKFSHKLI